MYVWMYGCTKCFSVKKLLSNNKKYNDMKAVLWGSYKVVYNPGNKLKIVKNTILKNMCDCSLDLKSCLEKCAKKAY